MRVISTIPLYYHCNCSVLFICAGASARSFSLLFSICTSLIPVIFCLWYVSLISSQFDFLSSSFVSISLQDSCIILYLFNRLVFSSHLIALLPASILALFYLFVLVSSRTKRQKLCNEVQSHYPPNIFLSYILYSYFACFQLHISAAYDKILLIILLKILILRSISSKYDYIKKRIFFSSKFFESSNVPDILT